MWPKGNMWIKIPLYLLPQLVLSLLLQNEEILKESLCSLILSLLILKTGPLRATLQLLYGLEIVCVKTLA